MNMPVLRTYEPRFQTRRDTIGYHHSIFSIIEIWMAHFMDSLERTSLSFLWLSGSCPLHGNRKGIAQRTYALRRHL